MMLSVKQGGIKYCFGVFGMTQPRIELRSPEPLANTLTIMSIGRSKEKISSNVGLEPTIMSLMLYQLS